MTRPMIRTESGRFVKLLGDGKALLMDEVDSWEGEEVTLWSKGQEERAKASKSLTQEDTKMFYFTPEEYAVYSRKLRASEGFDVGDVPAHVMLEVIRPVRHQSDPIALQQAFAEMAKVALGIYNENQGTRYQFFQVIRVNYVCTGALWYYITFQAKKVMDGSQLKNFQALMSPGRRGSEAKVEFCRVEPKPELPEDTMEGQVENLMLQNNPYVGADTMEGQVEKTGSASANAEICCILCSENFASENDFVAHMEGCHQLNHSARPTPSKNAGKTPVIQSPYDTKKGQVHAARHPLEPTPTCAECSKKFGSLNKLEAHVKNVHTLNRSARPTPSKKAANVTPSKNAGKTPVIQSPYDTKKGKVHAARRPPLVALTDTWRCIECSKKFESLNKLEAHVKNVHTLNRSAKPTPSKKAANVTPSKNAGKTPVIQSEQQSPYDTKKRPGPCGARRPLLVAPTDTWRCIECSKLFLSGKDLAEHLAEHRKGIHQHIRSARE